MKFNLVIFMGACVLVSKVAVAVEQTKPVQNPDRHLSTCYTYDHKFSEAPLFEVKTSSADEQVPFSSKPEVCSTPNCKDARKDYLVKGDVVLGWPAAANGFRCVYYGTKRGKLISGFLPDSKLTQIKDDGTPRPSDWTGRWIDVDENDQINIELSNNGRMSLTGRFRYTAQPRYDLAEFHAVAEPDGNQIHVTDKGNADCKVELKLRNKYLVANESGSCGGFNARFMGTYVKKEPRKKQ